jgi:exodeoxyribonuclease V gamma subunit
MAFQLQISNSLNQLANQLSEDISDIKDHVFRSVPIVTQTEGMNSWLKLQIAEKTGIAANIQFSKPNDIIHKIYYLLGGNFTQVLSKDNLSWVIYQLLSENDFTNQNPSIASYYNYEGVDSDLKRMALAEKIADLFDQYQIYRTDMITNWNNNITSTEEENWQKELWVRAKSLVGKQFPDKTLIGNFIKEALENQNNVNRLQQKLPTIYLFGISVITEYHLEIFQNLSAHIDIHFFLLNPAPYDYWFEDKSEKLLSFLKRIGKLEITEQSNSNPLLTAWGKIIQDTFSLLFKNDELINAYNELESSEPKSDTLLHKIQSAIFQNQKEEKENLFNQKFICDGSITINSCYSPAREVEVLYNYLVHLIDQKKELLSARDIVVMVSDIDLYASYIKAVFDNAPYKFNYTIADESYATTDSISNALLSILSISEQNFTSEEVVRLLDFSFIRNGLKIQDTDSIRKAVDAANIRFGIEGNKENDTNLVSWKYGLQRIMYGICMSGGEEYGEEENSFFPLDIIESSESYGIIRFVYFVEILIDLLKERRQPKNISGWVNYIEKVLKIFVPEDSDIQEEDYRLLMAQLERYNLINEIFKEEISYEVFIHGFSPSLSDAKRSHTFAGAGITFCSLIPMRSIPFKVVALLGLNFDNFPRKDKKLNFNLIEQQKRKGDRNVKENDKHLFLETLISAQEYLYISYVGQSVKDNSALPPSSLVDELLDYIESVAIHPDEVREQLIVKQPLHGFSKKYSSIDSRYYSYLLDIKEVIKDITQEREIEVLDFSVVPLYQLISFLKNPIKVYYNSILGIYYNVDEITLRDTEIFELNGLDNWQLKTQLLKTTVEDEKRFKIQKLKTGGLPLKNMATVVINDLEEEISFVKNTFIQQTEGKKESQITIDLIIGQHTLKGSVRNIYGNKLISVSFSKNEIKYILEGYINYLAIIASGQEIEFHFVSHLNKTAYQAEKINQEDAIIALNSLLEIYVSGHLKMLPFLPDLKMDLKKLDELDKGKFDKAIDKSHKDIYFSKEYESGFFDEENKWEEYQTLSKKVLVPMMKVFPDYPF